MPVSCHIRGCKAPLSRIVSGTISSELPLPLPFRPVAVEVQSNRYHHPLSRTQYNSIYGASERRIYGLSYYPSILDTGGIDSKVHPTLSP